MQDNAPIHKAKIVAKWFKENVVEVINWPLYSPDLNPIETLGYNLRRGSIKGFPISLECMDQRKRLLRSYLEL